jgi:DNA-binding SARP family transcriptional activator/TolB-like protein/Flp pilus assembly protein TadD
VVAANVETQPSGMASMQGAMQFRLLGPLTVCRGRAPVELPKSRKVRALTAYLALSERPLMRSALCELLWDAPSDPRGELRWCLSRIRSIVDETDRSRVRTAGDAVTLDLSDCSVDVLEIGRATKAGLDKLSLPVLCALAQRFGGEFLEGLHLDASPLFSQWLTAERRRLASVHAQLLSEIVHRLPAHSEEFLPWLERWLKADPFERRAHELLLEALVQRGRPREAEEHLAATIRLFELEGLEWLPMREAFRAARANMRPPEIEIQPVPVKEPAAPEPADVRPARRASICVMPFLERCADGLARTSLGDGLADDVITRLAKLRMLMVIARGTAFALSDRSIGAEEAARILAVDYLVSGSVQRRDGRMVVKIELAETRQPRVVWADELECAQDDALRGLDEIGHSIVACIAEEVEQAERNRAVLKAPSSLDAWEAYHRGLWHIYRFNSVDNDRAEHFFRLSAQLDPTFARAHAGLSFAHFQNAFLHRLGERERETDRAYAAAGQSLMADDRDPAAHWAMGRALWLRGRETESLAELTTSVDLSPNFALGHYTLGFVQSQSGDPQAAIAAIDQSRRLSPFDPLLFAMLSARALAHARRGEYEAAATWAMKGASRPNAHVHILAIAAQCLALAGRLEEARGYVARVHERAPEYAAADFFHAFRFSGDGRALFERGAQISGLS